MRQYRFVITAKATINSLSVFKFSYHNSLLFSDKWGGHGSGQDSALTEPKKIASSGIELDHILAVNSTCITLQNVVGTIRSHTMKHGTEFLISFPLHSFTAKEINYVQRDGTGKQ